MANDSKYTRLYPERAVAPLRAAVTAMLYTPDTVTRKAVADALDGLDRLGFPPDEPLFLLRGQDTLAPAAVAFYFDRWRHAGLPMELGHSQRFIEAMEGWQPRKLPD